MNSHPQIPILHLLSPSLSYPWHLYVGLMKILDPPLFLSSSLDWPFLLSLFTNLVVSCTTLIDIFIAPLSIIHSHCSCHSAI